MKKIIALLLLFTVAFVSSISMASPVSTRYVFLDDKLNTVNGKTVDENFIPAIIPVDMILRNSDRIVVITTDNAPADLSERFTIVIMEETTFNKFMDLR